MGRVHNLKPNDGKSVRKSRKKWTWPEMSFVEIVLLPFEILELVGCAYEIIGLTAVGIGAVVSWISHLFHHTVC